MIQPVCYMLLGAAVTMFVLYVIKAATVGRVSKEDMQAFEEFMDKRKLSNETKSEIEKIRSENVNTFANVKRRGRWR